MGVDFVDFSFNGKSNRELGLLRVSDGSRYNEQLLPQLKDNTVDPEGVDGVLFFNTFYKTKQITLNVAYDSVTETQIRQIRKTFNGRQPASLIFHERPYKIYLAKVTGTPEFKFIPFDERVISTGNTYILPTTDPIRAAIPGDDGERTETVIAETPIRIYKGEGTFTLSAFDPFGHTPQANKFLDSEYYNNFTNVDEWKESAGLLATQGDIDIYSNGIIPVYNPGDLDTPFKLKFQVASTAETTITLGMENGIPEYVLTLNAPSGTRLLLDSKQGLLYLCNSSFNQTSTVVNNYITGGTALFKIRPCEIDEDYQFSLTNVSAATIEYDYLYY